MLGQMREYLQRKYTPLVKPRKACASCSVKDICIPRLGKQKSAKKYIEGRLNE